MIKLADSPLTKQIIAIIEDKANNNPAPLLCKITRTYNDGFVDVKLNDTGDNLHYIQVIGDDNLDKTGLLVFVNGDLNNPIVITSGSDGGGGDVDLKDYVKKTDLTDKTKYDIDLNLNFGLSGQDDNIRIDMDIVDYIVSKTINIQGE